MRQDKCAAVRTSSFARAGAQQQHTALHLSAFFVNAGASRHSAGLRTPGRSRASSVRREGSSGRMGPGTTLTEQESARSRTTISGASTSSAAAVQETVAAAVRQMQQNLQEGLHDERYRVKGLLGRGGFGTVYRGEHHASDDLKTW